MIAEAGDVLAEEYMNRYLEDGMYENAEIPADEIKNELMSVLGEADSEIPEADRLLMFFT